MHWQGATEAPRAVGFHLRPLSDPQTELKSELIFPDSLSRILSLLGFLEAIFPGTGSPGRQGIWVLDPGFWEYWERSFFFWQNNVRMWAPCLSCLSFEYLVQYLHIEVIQYIHVGKQMNQFDDWRELRHSWLLLSAGLLFDVNLLRHQQVNLLCVTWICWVLSVLLPHLSFSSYFPRMYPSFPGLRRLLLICFITLHSSLFYPELKLPYGSRWKGWGLVSLEDQGF